LSFPREKKNCERFSLTVSVNTEVPGIISTLSSKSVQSLLYFFILALGEGDQLAAPLPYLIKTLENEVQISYPEKVREMLTFRTRNTYLHNEKCLP
jgi:hypothetical protein